MAIDTPSPSRSPDRPNSPAPPNSPDQIDAPTPSAIPSLLLLGWLGGALLWWSMAFARLPTATAPWLAEARRICFGALENGLPDARGWSMLVVPPLGLLVSILVVWGGELRADLGRRWRTGGGKAILLTLALLPAAQAIWVGVRVSEAPVPRSFMGGAALQPMPESYPRLGRPVSPFRLTAHDGQEVTLASLRGQPAALTFAFSHCATVCPATVHSTMQGVADSGIPARMVILTLDPWRDTPRALAAAHGRWSLPEGVAWLTGSPETVNAVLDGFDMPRQRDEKTGDITHPPLVYILDREGLIAYALTSPSPAWIAEALRRAARDG